MLRSTDEQIPRGTDQKENIVAWLRKRTDARITHNEDNCNEVTVVMNVMGTYS